MVMLMLSQLGVLLHSISFCIFALHIAALQAFTASEMRIGRVV